jgi:hypothetical protein
MDMCTSWQADRKWVNIAQYWPQIMQSNFIWLTQYIVHLLSTKTRQSIILCSIHYWTPTGTFTNSLPWK